jgi:hypothetical protein
MDKGSLIPVVGRKMHFFRAKQVILKITTGPLLLY